VCTRWQFTSDPVTLPPNGVIDPLGHLATYTYDGAGNVLTKSDGIDTSTGPVTARTTTYTYDTLNDEDRAGPERGHDHLHLRREREPEDEPRHR
jgi:YD repeat-containing protein